jgi:AraC-like DNA-binding protein
MVYYLKYDAPLICRQLILAQLSSSGINYSLKNLNEVDIQQNLSDSCLNKLRNQLANAGIEMVFSQKAVLVNKIKEAITNFINQEDNLILSKTSQHLAKTLNNSYRFLSGVFSEVTYTTIENYIILQKIEKAKEMIALEEQTFAEIAWKLNYSSAAHFSMQFKNTTGLTPTQFKRIITQRKYNNAPFAEAESNG